MSLRSGRRAGVEQIRFPVGRLDPAGQHHECRAAAAENRGAEAAQPKRMRSPTVRLRAGAAETPTTQAATPAPKRLGAVLADTIGLPTVIEADIGRYRARMSRQ